MGKDVREGRAISTILPAYGSPIPIVKEGVKASAG